MTWPLLLALAVLLLAPPLLLSPPAAAQGPKDLKILTVPTELPGLVDVKGLKAPRNFRLATPPSGGTDPGSSGTLMTKEDPQGPDSLTAFVSGLRPNTCFAMFLTNNPTTGSTPGSLLGKFCTNQQGRGQLAVVTEIFDGFVFFNRRLDDNGDGVVVGNLAGVLSSGGFMVPTNVIRIYRAQPDGGVATVFSGAAGQPGGLHTLSSPPLN